jgi:putative transposase
MWYYQSKRDDSEVVDKLSELAEQLPTRGFDEYYGRIRQQGYQWNRKRVLRIYRNMKLGLRRKHKRRLPSRVKEPLMSPDQHLHTWSMDFMSDVLADKRKVRVLNVIDDYNREALALEAGLSFPANRVIRVLTLLEEEIGQLPKYIRVDNGPEFTSKIFQQWCKNKRITIKYIQPGSPTQNAFIERFNRYFREDVLDAYWFEDLDQLRTIMESWRMDYNENHPHKSLGGLTP